MDVTKTGIRMRPKASYPMPHNFLVEMCGVVFRDTLGRLPKEQAEEIFGRVFKPVDAQVGGVAEEAGSVEEKQEEKS